MDTLTPDMLAEALQEPNTSLLARVLMRLGEERCQGIFADTLQIESTGGMLVHSGKRRRTPGGVFFELVKKRCNAKERYFIFANDTPAPAKTLQEQGTSTQPQGAVVHLTIELWKGLTPMPVTATLKLVLRDLPETRERDGMVFMALQHEPKGLPKGISLDSGPLYLSSPVKQWRTACTRAEQIRATGTPALLIVETHVSTKEGALIGVVKGIQVVEGKATPATAS
jgi:hypothetical protein